MLEIVWRNPKRMVRARVCVDKIWRNNPGDRALSIAQERRWGAPRLSMSLW